MVRPMRLILKPSGAVGVSTPISMDTAILKLSKYMVSNINGIDLGKGGDDEKSHFCIICLGLKLLLNRGLAS